MEGNEEQLNYIGKCNYSYFIWYVSTESPKPLFYGTQTNTGIWSKVSGPKQIMVGVLTLPLKQVV